MRRYNFLLQFLCSALLCSFSNYSNGTHLQRCTEAHGVLLGRHFHCEEQQQQQQYLPQQHFVVAQTADSCPRARRNGTLGMGLGGNIGASGHQGKASKFRLSCSISSDSVPPLRAWFFAVRCASLIASSVTS